MDDTVAGVREEELGMLAIEVSDYADGISEIFDRMNASMERMLECCRGTPYQRMAQYYAEVQASYAVVKGNIVSYSDDLIKLIEKIRSGDKDLDKAFQAFTDETNSRTKTAQDII